MLPKNICIYILTLQNCHRERLHGLSVRDIQNGFKLLVLRALHGTELYNFKHFKSSRKLCRSKFHKDVLKL